MAWSVNKVVLLGRLGGDPEIRSIASGSKVVNFSLATSDSWKDKTSGEWQEKTQWHKIVAWQNEKFGPRVAETAEKYLRKGDLCLVHGEIEYRSWDDRDGNKRYVTEIKVEKLIPLGRGPGPAQTQTRSAEPTAEEMKEELAAAKARKKAETTLEDFPEALDAKDDDLPF